MKAHSLIEMRMHFRRTILIRLKILIYVRALPVRWKLTGKLLIRYPYLDRKCFRLSIKYWIPTSNWMFWVVQTWCWGVASPTNSWRREVETFIYLKTENDGENYLVIVQVIVDIINPNRNKVFCSPTPRKHSRYVSLVVVHRDVLIRQPIY